MSRKKTHEEYVAELAIKNPNVIVIDIYMGANTPIKHYCTKHNIYWNMSPHNALQGKGCKKCKKEKESSSKRKPHEKYVEELRVNNPHIEVLEKYIDSKTAIVHHCLIHDVSWSVSPDSILHCGGCPKCHYEKVGRKLRKTNMEYVELLQSVNKNIKPIEKYVDARTKIKHICLIDGHIWKVAPHSVLNGCGCPKCAGNIKKTHEEYVLEVLKINPDVSVVGKYDGAHNPILHKCKVHECEWLATPNCILAGCGCPQCQESYGERQIRQWLESHEIAYQYQKTFSDCKDKKALPFDFYIQKYNICIEYDGKQHFEPVDFANKGTKWAEEKLKTTMYHDEIKNRYCKDNNIYILRIPYFKNIQEELDNFYSFNIVTSMAV